MREHIAGDLISAPRQDPETGTNESILGTGFWFLGEAVHAPTDVRGDEADRINNQIDVFGKAFLGMTLACARCHDHKFDPIPTIGLLRVGRISAKQSTPGGPVGPASPNRTADGRNCCASSRRRSAVGRVDVDPPGIRPSANFAEYLTGGAGSPLRCRHDDRRTPPDVALDEQLLDRFVAALRDDELQSADHPLHAWRVLSTAATRVRRLPSVVPNWTPNCATNSRHTRPRWRG